MGWVAGLLGLAAAVAVVVTVLLASGLGESANVAQLVSIPLTAVPVLLVLVAWQRRTARPVPVTPARLAEARGALAVAVRARWEQEAQLRGLLPDPIPVPWRITHHDKMQDAPGAISTGSLLLFDGGDDLARLAEYFRRGLKRQRMVLLGDAGTGKTSLAVLLLRELLPGPSGVGPVPILLTASTWSGQSQMTNWLAERLTADYPALLAPEFGPEVVRALITDGHVLPVLDGLDEVPGTARAGLLDALNRTWATRPLILTSRTAAFAEAVERGAQIVSAALVLEPDPLAPATAAAYLAGLPGRPHAGSATILALLRGGNLPQHQELAAGLTEITSTALGLWLLGSVYFTPRLDARGQPQPPPDPAPLLAQTTPETMRAHLLDHLIPALLAARPPLSDRQPDDLRPRRTHDPDQTRRRLGYLAHHLTHHATLTEDPEPSTEEGRYPGMTTDLAWWRLAHDTAAITFPIRLLPSVLAVMAFVVLWWAYDYDRLHSDYFSATRGWPSTAIGVVFVGAWTTWVMPRFAAHMPGLADIWHRFRLRDLRALASRVLQALALLCGIGVLAGGVAVLLTVAIDDSVPLLPMFLTVMLDLMVGWLGLSVLLIMVVQPWMETPSQTGAASTPQSSLRADRRVTLVRLGLAVLVAFVLWLFASNHYSLGDLIGFVVAAVFLSSIRTRRGAWLAFLAAEYRLARRHHLPYRLMSFLDDMHRLGLLRAVGPMYQFRHEELRRHLAAAAGMARSAG